MRHCCEYGVGHRQGLDLALLWLWCRLTAVALIQPLTWELPYTAGLALKSKKKKIEVQSFTIRTSDPALKSSNLISIMESV